MVKFFEGLPLFPSRCVLTPRVFPLEYRAPAHPFAHKLVVRETGFKDSSEKTLPIQESYAALAADEERNQLILDDVVLALEDSARRSC